MSGEGRPLCRPATSITCHQRLSAADLAELDVLLWELADAYNEHRQNCEWCAPSPCPTLAAFLEHKAGCWKCQNGVCVATEIYGEPCWIRQHWIAHGETCKRCIPCPYLKASVSVVVDWRQRRELLTRAEQLRLERKAHLAA